MASLSRKTYDTDVITLRRIFAYNPDTNAPISPGTILAVTGARGAAGFIDPLQISSIRELSTLVGNAAFANLSTGNLSVSSITFLDGASQAEQLMTVSSGVLYLNNSTIMGTGNLVTGQLVSSIIGLGTVGYVSTLSTSQLSTGCLRSGDIRTSTVNFIDTANGSLRTLTASNDFLYFNGGVVNYANINYNTSTYIYQVSSVSTIYAFTIPVSVSSATNLYINTNYYSSVSFSTGKLTTSSVNFMDTTNGTEQLLAVSSGQLILNGAAVIADLTKQQLFSTVTGLGTIGYVSAPQLLSTTDGLITNLLPPYFASTVFGLGDSGYTSNTQLASTTSGLLTNLFPPLFASTVIGLGDSGYISSSQFLSSMAGVPTVAGMVSSVVGLGTIGYVSSSQLTSTTTGLLDVILPPYVTSIGSLYVSTPSLLSSLSNLYVPFAGNPSGAFQLFAQSNTLNFGLSGSSTSQIFVGDARRGLASGNTDPLIKISQDVTTNPRAADVLNVLGGVNNLRMLKVDSNLNLGVGLNQAQHLNATGLGYTLQTGGSFFAINAVISTNLVASNYMITSTMILADSMTFSSFGPATSNIRLALATGDAYKPTGATWKTLSDLRIKENIVEADYSRCYSDIKTIPLRRYRYISSFVEQAGVMDKTVLGFIAQELATVMPKSVTSQSLYGVDDLNTISVDQINMASLGALKKTMQDKEVLESTTRGLMDLNDFLRGEVSSLQAEVVIRAEQFNTILDNQTSQYTIQLSAQSNSFTQTVSQLQQDFSASLSTLRGEMESMKNDLSMSHSIL
jgi:hypothetical protein